MKLSQNLSAVGQFCLSGLKHATFKLMQIDKIRGLYARFFSDFYQFRGLEEASGIIQR